MREKKPINIRVGKNIQLVREERHFTQEELSEQIGVTPNHLSAIERGVSGVSLELLEKLCQALNVTADYLLFGRTTAEEMDGEEFAALLRDISQNLQKVTGAMETITEAAKELQTQKESDP